MAHRRLVAAIAENQREGTTSSLCMYNEDLRSKHFKIATQKEFIDTGALLGRCGKDFDITRQAYLEHNTAKYHKVQYVPARKRNILQRLWDRLRQRKLRKMAEKLTATKNNIKNTSKKWYQRFAWCNGGDDIEKCSQEEILDRFEQDVELITSKMSLGITGKQTIDYDDVSISSSEGSLSDVIDVDEDKEYAYLQRCESTDSEISHELDHLTSSDLDDSARKETPSATCSTGIGSTSQLNKFPTEVDVDRPVVCNLSALPAWLARAPDQPYKAKSKASVVQSGKPASTPRPLPSLAEYLTVKEPTSQASEVDEDIEQAFSDVCKTPKIDKELKRKKRENFLYSQMPNLEKGPSGFAWELDTKLKFGAPCDRSSTPRPVLTSHGKRQKRQNKAGLELKHKQAEVNRKLLGEERLEKIRVVQERVKENREIVKFDDKMLKQARMDGQSERAQKQEKRLEEVRGKIARKGATDRKLQLARERREQAAKAEQNGVRPKFDSPKLSSTRAAGFKSSNTSSNSSIRILPQLSGESVAVNVDENAQITERSNAEVWADFDL